MRFRSWLDGLQSVSATRRAPPSRRLRQVGRKLVVNALEDRCLPAFLAPLSYPAGVAPYAVIAADFNNDTVLDLAASGDSLSVLLGKGDGTFQSGLNSATSAGSLAVADFNGDGNLDLVTTGMNVLLGNGDGTFQPPTSIDFGYSSVGSVAVGDFNADGKPDLAVTTSEYVDDGWDYVFYHHYEFRAHVLLGNGDGSFGPPSTTWLNGGYQTSATVADFNGDGQQDLATVSYEYGETDFPRTSWSWTTVNVLRGNGDGTLRAPADFEVGAYPNGPYPNSMVAGDVDGDGDLDLVTANADSVSVLLGDGLGAFGASQEYGAGGSYYSAVLRDFNGDGKLDIAAANSGSYPAYAGSLSVFLGRGDGAFTPGIDSAAVSDTYSVAAGDFNGDGWPDAATANNGSNVSVLINDHSWPPADLPLITVNDVTVSEGNTNTVYAVFTVSLSAAGTEPVTVQYATADGRATAGSDYTAASGTLTLAPGETTQTITVAVSGDRSPEANETFVVNLSAATQAFIGDRQGVGTVLDDEPTISIDSVWVTEGDTGTVNAVFTASLSAPYDEMVTVSYVTYGAGAVAGRDFTATSGTLTFIPGQTSETMTVAVVGDLIYEHDESFYLHLGSASANAAIANAYGYGLILDDDPPPSVSISNASVVEGNAGTRLLLFTVTLSAAAERALFFSYATADGTATAADHDYATVTDGSVAFYDGATNGTIKIVIYGDNRPEPDETFFVNVWNSYVTVAPSQGQGSILNDDSSPSISISDVALTEGNTGAANATFIVSLSAAYGQAVTVNYSTANGTATAGGDYVGTSGTLVFAPGETSKIIVVAVLGDRSPEANETFVVNLSSPANGSVADGQGVGTILDDEPRISISDVARLEGNLGTAVFVFTVSLTAAYDQPVTFQFATGDGTARTADQDYQAQSGTLTFAPGETTKTISVVVYGDTKQEVDETFFVNLSSPSSNALLVDGLGIGTVFNDDH